MKWQWFVGGKAMFMLSILVFLIFIFVFIGTFVIDYMAITTMKKVNIDPTPIKELSENYLKSLGISIDKPIIYSFAKHKNNKNGDIILGTFHEWNDTYYINISIDLYNMPMSLTDTVKHETRHMIVEYLKDKKIINLDKYTEEIAQEKNNYYNDLFNAGVYLLKNKEEVK